MSRNAYVERKTETERILARIAKAKRRLANPKLDPKRGAEEVERVLRLTALLPPAPSAFYSEADRAQHVQALEAEGRAT